MTKNELNDCFGCLSHKKTLDEDAVRRQAPELDRDLFALNFGRHYAVDTFQKIIPSKAYRRLGSKTQAATAFVNAHIRNRLSHTGEVASVVSIIARILGLNEDLCLAIAFGHDIGHAPFGHIGEDVISDITGKDFRHRIFGVIVAQHIERQGKGLNLTQQTLEGMLNHAKDGNSLTRIENVSEEANVAMNSDKVVYTWCDVEDLFERLKIVDYGDYPEVSSLVRKFGANQQERLTLCIESLCCESAEMGYVSFEESEVAQDFAELKEHMYEVYKRTNLLNGPDILKRTYFFLSEVKVLEGIDPAIVLALMTDTDVLWLNDRTSVSLKDFQECSVYELIEHLKGRNIDFLDPDLNW